MDGLLPEHRGFPGARPGRRWKAGDKGPSGVPVPVPPVPSAFGPLAPGPPMIGARVPGRRAARRHLPSSHPPYPLHPIHEGGCPGAGPNRLAPSSPSATSPRMDSGRPWRASFALPAMRGPTRKLLGFAQVRPSLLSGLLDIGRGSLRCHIRPDPARHRRRDERTQERPLPAHEDVKGREGARGRGGGPLFPAQCFRERARESGSRLEMRENPRPEDGGPSRASSAASGSTRAMAAGREPPR